MPWPELGATFPVVEVAKKASENLSDANVTQRLRGGIIMLTVAWFSRRFSKVAEFLP